MTFGCDTGIVEERARSAALSQVAVAGGCLAFAARNEIDCFRANPPVNSCRAMELLSTPVYKACAASKLVHLSFECSPSMLWLKKEMPMWPQSPIFYEFGMCPKSLSRCFCSVFYLFKLF